jgi:hypothetical protein
VTDLSSYVNKTVEFKFNGAALRFDLSHALFSSFDIDQGTRLLLRTVARDPVLASARRILDEGCGVGVIGLCVAKAFPEAELVLRDRDSLAVAFAERNRLSNKLRGTTAWVDPEGLASRVARSAPRVEWGLLADGREGGVYDFVLSNLPAKAGAPVLASFFARLTGRGPVSAPALLSPAGRAGVVVVKPLAEATKAWIEAAGLAIVGQGRGSGHEAFVVERDRGAASEPVGVAPVASGPAPASAGLETYLRGESRFELVDLVYRAQGFWGLPEFDTPSFGSAVAAEVAARSFAAEKAAGSGFPPLENALFLEPGVGHAALWVARALRPRQVTAASRDALALAATGRNLLGLPERSRPGFAAVDALGAIDLPAASFELVAERLDIVPERDWIGEAWARAGVLARPGGVYLAYGPPTEMVRLEKRRPSKGIRWSLVCQKRKKGFVAAAWRRA